MNQEKWGEQKYLSYISCPLCQINSTPMRLRHSPLLVLVQKVKANSWRCSSSATSRPSLWPSSLLKHHSSSLQEATFTHPSVSNSAHHQYNEHQPGAAPNFSLLDGVETWVQAKPQRSAPYCLSLSTATSISNCIFTEFVIDMNINHYKISKQ